MADPWPSNLPQNPIDMPFQQAYGNSLARTQMDVGPPKVRRRYTARIDRLTMVFEMTEAEVATFETFYGTTIKDGSKKFTFTHPRTGTSGDWRFVQPPTVDYVAHELYHVSVVWELLP